MQIFEKRIEVKHRGDILYICGLFDTHLGNAAVAEEKLKETVEWIKKTANAYWFAGGDMIEGICPDDKRWLAEAQKSSDIKELGNMLNFQIELLSNMLMPIKNKCLWWMPGNHENTIQKRHYVDVCAVMAHRFGVPKGGFNTYVRLCITRIGGGTKAIKIFASHGGGGGIKLGATINRVVDLGGMIDADVYIAGHDHKDINARMPLITMTGSQPPQLMEKQRLFIRAGSYLKTYAKGHSGYGEEKWYQPVELGSPIFAIKAFPIKVINRKTIELSPFVYMYSREQEENSEE